MVQDVSEHWRLENGSAALTYSWPAEGHAISGAPAVHGGASLLHLGTEVA